MSCHPSAGEVPLWGAQTGTSTLSEFRYRAGDRHFGGPPNLTSKYQDEGDPPTSGAMDVAQAQLPILLF